MTSSMSYHPGFGMVRAFIGLFACAIFGLPGTANALTFTPSETEWLTWPEYCRVRYVGSGAGRNSQYLRRVSPSQIELVRDQLGKDVWHWLHHYCAGLVYFDRSKKEVDGIEKTRLIDEAESQIMGQYMRVPRTDSFFAQVATTLARIHRERKNYPEAIDFVEQAIDSRPGFSTSYAIGSLIYRDNGDLGAAKDILLRGNEACEGKSAEVHYFLGLVYIELSNYEEAVKHAEQAYALGYPLPGLRAKLSRSGYSIN